MWPFKKKEGEEEPEEALEEEIEEAPKEEAAVSPTDIENFTQMAAEVEKLKAKGEASEQFRKVDAERFARINEQIGELRNMLIENQRELQKVTVEATKASDLVKTVQPEQLMREVKREDMKIEEVKAKLETYETFSKSVLDRLSELKKVVDAFRGVESVINLSKEIKDDIVEIKKMRAMVEGNADKVSNMFTDFQKQYTDFLNYKKMIKDLQKSFDDVKKDFEMVIVKSKEAPTHAEFESFKEETNKKLLSALDNLNSFKLRLAELTDVEKNIAELKQNDAQISDAVRSLQSKASSSDNAINAVNAKVLKTEKDIEAAKEFKINAGSRILSMSKTLNIINEKMKTFSTMASLKQLSVDLNNKVISALKEVNNLKLEVGQVEEDIKRYSREEVAKIKTDIDKIMNEYLKAFENFAKEQIVYDKKLKEHSAKFEKTVKEVKDKMASLEFTQDRLVGELTQPKQ